MAFVGLSLVGVLRSRVMQACGSAMGFATKRGRLHRLGQARTGVAFAVYCAGCCGPLLIPLYLSSPTSGVKAGHRTAMQARREPADGSH